MFDLAKLINFGQKIIVNDTEYRVVERFTNGHAVVVKADDLLPAVCYLIKIPDANTTG